MLEIGDYGSSDSDSSLPPQPKKLKSQRPPKKFTIALPSLKQNDDSRREDDEFPPPLKKRKTGVGSSSLLAMLPVPKQTKSAHNSTRVLGVGKGLGNSDSNDVVADNNEMSVSSTSKLEASQPSGATLFRPTSLQKGKKNVNIEETNTVNAQPFTSATPIDFFSLGATETSGFTFKTPVDKSCLSVVANVPSSAPSLPTFEIPEPTPTDPYPGYYQLPSGTWATYETEYYTKFMAKWEKEYNTHVRALEKGTAKGFEGLRDAAVEEVDAIKEMEKAKKEIKDREDKKAITQGAGGGPVAPTMNINASKLSGIARSRHQLSTLLNDAFQNREALEERIAQGKRNRKEAGNKYGF